ncbi:helix-turn-helix domain-containing protein [Nocardia sp. NPDC004278]
MTTLPYRAMGRLLRELRGEHTQLAASRVLEISKQGVGRLEKGQPIKMTTADLNNLLDFYQAASEQRQTVLALWAEVREAKSQYGNRRGWWRAYADTYGAHFDHYLSLEESANRLTTFQLTLLPGLLQTPAYRRAVVEAAYPEISRVELERRVELMIRRQARLSVDADFMVDVVLAEMALRLPVGGPKVMAEQLDSLIKVSRLPNVSIRVVPSGVVGYPGLVMGSFTLCEFPAITPGHDDLLEPPVVYIESHEGALFLDEDAAIARYRSAILDIQRVALSSQQTRRLLSEIAESLR